MPATRNTLALFEINVTPHSHGPAMGYFWQSTISPDWSGPCDTAAQAEQAALRDVLYYARVGKAYASEGAQEADALLPHFNRASALAGAQGLVEVSQ